MFFRMAAPVNGLLKSRSNGLAPQKTVHDLLTALAEIRERKAELEKEERELVAATRARLLEEQETLKTLERKVQDCGIELADSGASAVVPSQSVESTEPVSAPAAQ
jgi:hypothetical protein